jgi:hypothetical protein|tara:strand:+ start:1944 stop:2348 length:405 start_codon:yes stop_codon:yes gene_type:complete
MRKINDSKGDLLCIVYKDEDWVEGLNFITDNSLFIQVGSWWYDNGKNLAKHKHNIVSREANITQEMVYVKSGSMLATIFDQEMNFVEEIVLKEGDMAIMAYGGHGYKILEDNTKIIEAKNGPFVSVEVDKVKYE